MKEEQKIPNLSKASTPQMKQITLEEYVNEFIKRYGKDSKSWKVVCPMCKTVQSIQDFIDAKVEKDKIQSYWGFSCIGRFIKGKGCDWTLGGLFQMHTLEIIDPEGNPHPRFEIAEEK